MLIVDDVGRGLAWANRQIAMMAERFSGQYVLILDDDDFLLYDDFVLDFKRILKAAETLPEVVVAKGWILERSFPSKETWKKKPKRGEIAAPNMIVRADIFNRYADAWETNRAGDWSFIHEVCKFRSLRKFLWWDKYIFYADPSGAVSEEEKRECQDAS